MIKFYSPQNGKTHEEIKKEIHPDLLNNEILTDKNRRFDGSNFSESSKSEIVCLIIQYFCCKN